MKKIMLTIAVTTALLSAGDLVYKNKKSVLSALNNGGDMSTWEDIDDVYKKDKEVVLKAIDRGLCIINTLDSSLQMDKEIILASLTKAHCRLKYADENLSNNKDFVIDKNSYKDFNLTRSEFQKDENVILAWIKDKLESIPLFSKRKKSSRRKKWSSIIRNWF